MQAHWLLLCQGTALQERRGTKADCRCLACCTRATTPCPLCREWLKRCWRPAPRWRACPAPLPLASWRPCGPSWRTPQSTWPPWATWGQRRRRPGQRRLGGPSTAPSTRMPWMRPGPPAAPPACRPTHQKHPQQGPLAAAPARRPPHHHQQQQQQPQLCLPCWSSQHRGQRGRQPRQALQGAAWAAPPRRMRKWLRAGLVTTLGQAQTRGGCKC